MEKRWKERKEERKKQWEREREREGKREGERETNYSEKDGGNFSKVLKLEREDAFQKNPSWLRRRRRRHRRRRRRRRCTSPGLSEGGACKTFFSPPFLYTFYCDKGQWKFNALHKIKPKLWCFSLLCSRSNLWRNFPIWNEKLSSKIRLMVTFVLWQLVLFPRCT